MHIVSGGRVIFSISPFPSRLLVRATPYALVRFINFHYSRCPHCPAPCEVRCARLVIIRLNRYRYSPAVRIHRYEPLSCCCHTLIVLSVGARAAFARKVQASCPCLRLESVPSSMPISSAPPTSIGLHMNPVPFASWCSLCFRNPSMDFSER